MERSWLNFYPLLCKLSKEELLELNRQISEFIENRDLTTEQVVDHGVNYFHVPRAHVLGPIEYHSPSFDAKMAIAAYLFFDLKIFRNEISNLLSLPVLHLSGMVKVFNQEAEKKEAAPKEMVRLYQAFKGYMDAYRLSMDPVVGSS